MPLSTTHQVGVSLSLHDLAAMLGQQGHWRARLTPSALVAFCAEQRLLLHARNPFDGNGVSWGLPRAPQPTQRRVVQLSINGDRQTVQRRLDDLLPHRADAEPQVRWAYSADEPPQPMPMRKDRQPHPLMFPFLPQPLRAFFVFCRSATG